MVSLSSSTSFVASSSLLLGLMLVSNSALAADQQATSNTLWLVVAAVLVFFMQAGFALLESGMTRGKNAVNVVMKNYSDVCLGGLAFWLLGFGLMFGNNITGFFGTSHWLPQFDNEWHYTFLLFQMMFAATAATIASGAMAERTRFWGYLVGAIIITAFIYPVFGSWVWGGTFGGQGWLAKMGFVDFAGSTVVHSLGAWCALAGIMVVGPRTGRFDPQTGKSRNIPGHNLNNVALGGFVLWLGWFGFNAGSTLQADVSLGRIALNTHLAACAGAAGSMMCQSLLGRPLFVTNTINGSIGGLVAITAGCATMMPGFAIATGFLAGFIVIIGSTLMTKLQLDDVVDAVPVHGFCGVWGTLAAGMFYQGDLFNWQQVFIQLLGCTLAFLWAFPLAYLMYQFINKTLGLRASQLNQQRGLDYTEHNERGYPEFESIHLHKPITHS